MAISDGEGRKGLASIFIYKVAIPLAFIWPKAACGCRVFVALMWLLPDWRLQMARGSVTPINFAGRRALWSSRYGEDATVGSNNIGLIFFACVIRAGVAKRLFRAVLSITRASWAWKAFLTQSARKSRRSRSVSRSSSRRAPARIFASAERELGTQIEAYKGTPAAMVHTMIRDTSRLPPGDPVKMATIIIDRLTRIRRQTESRSAATPMARFTKP